MVKHIAGCYGLYSSIITIAVVDHGRGFESAFFYSFASKQTK